MDPYLHAFLLRVALSRFEISTRVLESLNLSPVRDPPRKIMATTSTFGAASHVVLHPIPGHHVLWSIQRLSLARHGAPA